MLSSFKQTCNNCFINGKYVIRNYADKQMPIITIRIFTQNINTFAMSTSIIEDVTLWKITGFEFSINEVN